MAEHEQLAQIYRAGRAQYRGLAYGAAGFKPGTRLTILAGKIMRG